jgi:hypothetical protein
MHSDFASRKDLDRGSLIYSGRDADRNDNNCGVSVLPRLRDGVDGDQPVMKGDGFGLEILEVVHASGAEMAEDSPGMYVLRLALFDEFKPMLSWATSVVSNLQWLRSVGKDFVLRFWTQYHVRPNTWLCRSATAPSL